MRSDLSLCIWGDGPGRPYDNVYFLEDIKYENNVLKIAFDDLEECLIFNPVNVVISSKKISVDNAESIIWKFYYYGKSKSNDTLTVIQYDKIDNDHVHVLEKGAFNSERIIKIKGKKAFDSFGNIWYVGDVE